MKNKGINVHWMMVMRVKSKPARILWARIMDEMKKGQSPIVEVAGMDRKAISELERLELIKVGTSGKAIVNPVAVYLDPGDRKSVPCSVFRMFRSGDF